MPLAVLILLGVLGTSPASAAKRELRPASVGKRLITFKLHAIEPRAIRSATLYSSNGKRRIRRSTVRRAARSGVLKLRRSSTRARASRPRGSVRSVRRNARLVVITDTKRPRVAWRTLTQGGTVSGVLTKQNGRCRVNARDNVGVRRVDFYLDAKRIKRDSQAPYACHWDTRAATHGWHKLSAVAVDDAGRKATASVSVMVSRSGVVAPPPPPQPSPFQDLVFEENFNGTSVNTSKWSAYNGPGHVGNGLRRPSAFSVSGGLLAVTATWDGTNIVSGGMAHRANYQYGRFEFRVRTEPDPTAQTSGIVLTWPQSNHWIPDGENDIYETAGGRNPFFTHIHYNTDGKSDRHYDFVHNADATQWHTMRMDWTAAYIKIYRDGVLTHTLTDTQAIRDVPHHLGIQLDAMSNRPLAGPVKMYVDWVKVYQ